MTARPSQIRAYRILSFLAILHSALVLGLKFTNYVWSLWWLGLATSLFFWVLVLAIHPGRSILRFLLPTLIAAAFFIPCAAIYGVLVPYSIERERLIHEGRIYRDKHNAAGDLRPQWLAADKLEKLLRSNPRIILYSIDADYQIPLEARKGYRQLGADEVILPEDMFADATEFVRMDKATGSKIAGVVVMASVGQTVNSIADDSVRFYGCSWQILRKETNGSSEAEVEIEATPASEPEFREREPYKAPAVLGYAEITDRAEQRELITALATSARHSWGGMLCHNPRHGLFVETGTTTVTLSICFECNNVYSWGPDGNPADLLDGFEITDAPESVFNATLQRHGVPVPQKL